MKKIILVTGAAGFIGYHLCKRLLKENYKVIGIDNLNDYYDVKLKESRLNQLLRISNANQNWIFRKTSLEKTDQLSKIFSEYKPNIVINLAAQAGVRYSIKNPAVYIDSNVKGFQNILDCSVKFDIEHLVYASSSSVYGGNVKLPYSEKDPVDHPVSLYAATKKCNELLAHAYSHIYQLPITGLRLFTVYGPWGRPDMAPMIFTKHILDKSEIKIFNNGDLSRDFTYIDDVIEVIYRVFKKPARANKNFKRELPTPESSWCPHRIFNVGNNQPILIMDFIKILEMELGIYAIKKFEKMQKGDVKNTFADTKLIQEWIGFSPNTSLEDGISNFVKWYKNYYK